jgi:hypothetical protein
VQGAHRHRCRRTGAGAVMLGGVASSSSSLSSSGTATAAVEKTGRLGLVAVAAGLGGGLGVLMGRLEDCGASPDAEGGDARRPCCGHAARIRRLRRGARVCGAGDRGAGEKGARAGGYTGLSRSGAARGASG